MNRVVIDVEARFIDHLSKQVVDSTKSLGEMENKAESAKKDVEALGKSKAKPTIDGENSKLMSKLKKSEDRLNKFGRSKASAVIDIIDKASSKMEKASRIGKEFGRRTWSAAVKIKDYATAPLRKIKESLFSIKSLVMAITAGVAAKQFIMNPINLADAYSSAQIGFTTLLGKEGGQQMMDQIDAFAKATPFKTAGVISNVQKMMAYGWDVNRVISDMQIIGDAAAATGKGDEGLTSIVYALSEIRSKGKLSTQELNQLASAGIKAKAYLAEGLGYGTSDAGMAQLAKDLEGGAIGANQAIEMILEGMKEFSGMMDKTANETVEGLKSQIEDTFEINIFRRWGQGLQDGAKKGLGSIVSLLDNADGALKNFGDMLYDIGSAISNSLVNKLEHFVSLVKEITGSRDFANADLSGKIKTLWNGLVKNPMKEWWTGKIVPWWEDTVIPWWKDNASRIGKTIGEGLSNGLLGLLGIFSGDAVKDGVQIGESFVSGFLDGFDAGAVTKAFVDAISNVWNQIPWYGKLLLGGAGMSKGLGVLSKGLGLTSTVLRNLGSAGAGTGILGFGAKAAIGMGAGNLVGGGSLGAGALSALGLTGTAGLVTAGVTAISGIVDLYQGYKNGDSTQKASGGWKVGGAAGGAALGAALGSVIPGLGPLVGAGIGGLAGSLVGWWKSSKIEEEAQRKAEEEAERIAKLEADAAEGLVNKFGKIRMSATEVKSAVNEMIGQDLINKANAASSAIATMDSSLDTFNSTNESLKKSVWLYTMRKDTKLTEEEISGLKESTKEFSNAASQYMKDAEYASSSSIKAIMGDSEAAQKVMEASSNYYSKLGDELAGKQKELSDTISEALSDGFISVDEEKSINTIREQISRITKQLQEEEHTANMNVIKAKYSGEDMSLESFEDMQVAMRDQAALTANAFWDEFGRASIGLQPDTEEWNALLGSTLGNISSVWEEAGSLGLDTLQSKWSDELGILGEDLASVLENNTMQDILNASGNLSEKTRLQIGKMLESMAPTTDEIRSVVSQYEEMGKDVPEALSSYLDTVDFYEALSKGPKAIEEFFANPENAAKIKPMVQVDANATYDELISGIQDSALFQHNLEVVLDAYADIDWQYNPLTGDLIEPTGHYQFNSSALVQLGWTYNEFDEKWVSPDGKYEFGTSVMVDANYETSQFPGTYSSFGIMSNYYASPRVTVSPVYTVTQRLSEAALGLSDSISAPYRQYRGGIIGPNGKEPDGFAGGGMVRGGAQLAVVAEEGTPEMIIPLGSQRRERGLKLWEKAGEMLGVRRFARGGRTDGGDEGLRFKGRESDEAAGSGKSVLVDVGGITFEIHVNGENKDSIVQAIKEQAAEIAETVAGIIADEIGGQFDNTPERGLA